MDALVGSDEELPLSARFNKGDSDSSTSVYAHAKDRSDNGSETDSNKDSEEEDYSDEQGGSTEQSGGTGESMLTSYAQSLDFEEAATLEERITYLMGLPQVGTQTDQDELKERYVRW